MQIWETSGKFPFRTLRFLGWTILLLTIMIIVVTVVDLGWSAGKFAGLRCSASNYENDANWQVVPCDHDVLVYTWVAAGIWASIVPIFAGIVGARFSRWRVRFLRTHRDGFAVLSGLSAVIFFPVIIVINALALAKSENVFWYKQDSIVQVSDAIKFSMPIVVIILACLGLFAALIGVFYCICCATANDYEKVYVRKPREVVRYQQPPPMPPPMQPPPPPPPPPQPIIMQAPPVYTMPQPQPQPYMVNMGYMPSYDVVGTPYMMDYYPGSQPMMMSGSQPMMMSGGGSQYGSPYASSQRIY